MLFNRLLLTIILAGVLVSAPGHAQASHAVLYASAGPELTQYDVDASGAIGAQVKQPSMLDTGIYAHQVRVNPSNKTVFLVTRGNGPTKTKPEDRGGVKVFSYADGVLKNLASIAPNGGVNFQPRHLDFPPTQPWVFLSLERQTQLQVYHLTKDGSLDALPLFTKDSVANAAKKAPLQNSGTLHVHPNGKFVYQATRSAGSDANGKA